jgi:peptide/nickel transport system substrate-binding protein
MNNQKKPIAIAIAAIVVVAAVILGVWYFGPSSSSPESQASTLRLASQSVVQTDPAFVSSDQEVMYANAVYDYLVDVDANNRVQPRLAKSWTVSDDGTTYTFELESGVTFHDGSAFTAEDVVWTFNRLRDPEIGSGAASLYDNVISIEATNDTQVIFTLSGNDPFFLFDLSDNRAAVIKADTSDPTNHNGTGPFKVAAFSAEDRIELEANPDYFVEGLPKLDRLEIISFSDDSAAANALKSNQVDLAWKLPSALFLSLQGEANVNTILVPTNGFILVRLRADEFPGNDPRVVEAIKLAVDRKELLNSAALGLGVLGNDTPIGPLYKDYHMATNLPTNIEQAQSLLADAGYADGISGLELFTPDTLGMPDVAVLVKEQLAEIGINVDVVQRPENLYYAESEWLDTNFGLTSWGSRPVAQIFVDQMLTCDAQWNEARFCDAEFDQLAEVAGTTLDEAERVAAYKRMQEIIQQKGTMIIPYYFSQNAAIRNNFEGFALKAFIGRTDFRHVELVSE